MTATDWQRWADEFRILDGETLAELLDRYESVARQTDDIAATLPSGLLIADGLLFASRN